MAGSGGSAPGRLRGGPRDFRKETTGSQQSRTRGTLFQKDSNKETGDSQKSKDKRIVWGLRASWKNQVFEG